MSPSARSAAGRLPDAPAILLVDDEQDVLFSYSIMFRGAGLANVISEPDSRAVMPLLQERPVAVAVLDLQMPHIGGFELLQQIREQHPQVAVIIVTAANEVEMAVACMKAGAIDYFVKPVERSRLIASVRRALESSELRRHNEALRRQVLEGESAAAGPFRRMATCSERMRGIFRYLSAVAASSQPVLIGGETGTGKELAARAVHEASGRNGEFVAVNLAGLDDQMFSDTLFGHVRGAFTGAMEKRDGLVARAAGGTLFLDEIGDLGEASQVKLLRLLQEGEYLQLGSDLPRRSDIRVIAATHCDLERLMREGRFRHDLFYRLNTHHVTLPPLRERREDLPQLLTLFIAEAAKSLGVEPPPYPPELVRYLETAHLPGNIRELRSMVHNAVACHSRGMLSMEQFLTRLDKGSTCLPTVAPEAWELRLADGRIPTLDEAERLLVGQALRLADGNQGVAARYLGITRQALNKRLVRSR